MKTEPLMKTVKDAGEASRETVADVLETSGRQIKRRSRYAGRFIDSGGKRIGRNLEAGAARMRGGGRFSPLRYVRRHPIQALMLAGLSLAIIAAFVLPVFLRNREEDNSDYFAAP